MSTEGLAIVFFMLALLNLFFGVYIFVKYKRASASDSNRASHNPADSNRQRAKDGMEEYERQVILDILRDQLKYSQEDYSELQGEMKALRVQVAKLENGQTATNNRLDNYRLLLSQIEANTRK